MLVVIVVNKPMVFEGVETNSLWVKVRFLALFGLLGGIGTGCIVFGVAGKRRRTSKTRGKRQASAQLSGTSGAANRGGDSPEADGDGGDSGGPPGVE
jgi:hypothetical protein